MVLRERDVHSMKEVLTWRQVAAQQWYLTKFCFKKTPGFMAFHLFESIEISISIFIEFTWMVNYVLTAVEQGEDFGKILRCMGILIVFFGFFTIPYGLYHHYALPRKKQMLYQALRMEIYEKAKEIDLSCYDDKDFYETFILATEETDHCIDRYLRFIYTAAGQTAGVLCSIFFCAYINPIALLVAVVLLPLELLCVVQENKKTVEARMERVSHEQKREYGNRVFYLSDYAGELRLYQQMKGKCRTDYEESNDSIRFINKKFGKQLFLYGLLHRVFLSRVVKEGAVWFMLLYQMLVLRVLTGAQLVTSRSCVFRISNSMNWIIEGCREAAENAAYVNRIREFLQMEPTIVSKAERPVPEGSGSLLVEHVDFGYLPGQSVLKDVTLAVEPGQKIALVGYNGSGKTTLVKLLL